MAQLPVGPPAAGLLPAPLLVTLELEAGAQAFFEAERRRWFPAALNRVPAHVSLFHALPGDQLQAIAGLLAEQASAMRCFAIDVVDVMKLGRGVAYALRSPQLDELHARLRAAWLPWLTRQDAQGFRPHIVIQNKAEPEAAQALHQQLAAQFRPWPVQAAGLLLWRYRGGPWEQAGSFPFAPGGR